MNHSQAITHLRSLAGIRYNTTYAPLNVHPGTEAPQCRGERGYYCAWVATGCGRRPSGSRPRRAARRFRSSLRSLTKPSRKGALPRRARGPPGSTTVVAGPGGR